MGRVKVLRVIMFFLSRQFLCWKDLQAAYQKNKL